MGIDPGDLADAGAEIVRDVMEDNHNQRTSDRGIIGAMANGTGLAVVRTIIISAYMIGALVLFIAYDKVQNINTRIDGVATDVHQLTHDVKTFVERTNTKITEHDMDMIRNADAIKSLEREVEGNGNMTPNMIKSPR